MARIGGRSLWLAWPAGLLCAATVAGLVWLAMPAVPVTVAWIGDTLRAATTAPQAASDEPVGGLAGDPDADLDCRALYPDRLWSELAWVRDVLLDQSKDAPATSVTALVDALQPVVRVTCSWRAPHGTVVSTLSRVGADAATIADAALRGQGFACDAYGDGIACRRVLGDVVEEHTLRGGLWIASVETAWPIDDYGVVLATHVWG